MSDLAPTVDTYLDGWNETQPARRAELIDQVWSADGRLIDPPLDASGRAEISDMAQSLHAQFPDHYFRRSSAIDEHHGHFRFAWELVSSDGTVALTGLDVGELAPDGTIARITGFFGDLPSEQVA
jgi:hypothetical protein